MATSTKLDFVVMHAAANKELLLQTMLFYCSGSDTTITGQKKDTKERTLSLHFETEQQPFIGITSNRKSIK